MPVVFAVVVVCSPTFLFSDVDCIWLVPPGFVAETVTTGTPTKLRSFLGGLVLPDAAMAAPFILVEATSLSMRPRFSVDGSLAWFSLADWSYFCFQFLYCPDADLLFDYVFAFITFLLSFNKFILSNKYLSKHFIFYR